MKSEVGMRKSEGKAGFRVDILMRYGGVRIACAAGKGILKK